MSEKKWMPSKSWVSKMLKKRGFSCRTASYKKGYQLDPNRDEKILEFQEKIIQFQEKNPDSNIWAMYETGIWNLPPKIKTITRRKNPKNWLRLTKKFHKKHLKNLSNRRDTMVGCISFRGEKMKPFFIEHKRQRKKNKIVVQKKIAGMNNEIWIEWINKFVQLAKKKDLLFLDNLSSHKNKEGLKILEQNEITVEFIPPYLAPYLSPLDNSTFSQFKSKLRRKKSENFKKKKKYCKSAWNSIKSENIQNYFKKCGLPVFQKQEKNKIDKKTDDRIQRNLPFFEENDINIENFRSFNSDAIRLLDFEYI